VAYADRSPSATIRISSRPPARAVAANRSTVGHNQAETAASSAGFRAAATGAVLSVWASVHGVVDVLIRRTSPPKGRRLLTTPLKTSPKHTRRRLVSLIVLVCLLFGGVVVKLANLQVLNPTQYQQFGASQRVREQTLAADRGTIFDRNGVELAMSLPQKSVFVDPKLVTDPAGEAARLAAVLGIPASEVEEKMRRANRFSYVARFLSDDLARKVADLGLPGVAFVEEPKRYAPSGEVLQPIVGGVDVDGVGTAGLEKRYTDQLSGTPGKLVLEQTPGGKTIPVGEHSMVPAVKGDDLILTIDRSMQFEVQRLLTEQVAAVGAKGGVVVVMKPDTGEILATVSVVRNDKDEVGPDGNLAGLTTVYEPGSVMKIVAIAGAIQDGKVTPDSVINLPPSLNLGGASFSDAEARGAVSWPVRTILEQSSNVGTILVSQQLGREQLVQYMHGFGFGTRTGIDFPGEQRGVVPAVADWSGSSVGSVPIGQGVSVTPVQMLAAYSTIANGGVYQSPRLVQATVDANGTKHPAAVAGTRQVISTDTANKMNIMLRSVVATGTGTKAAVAGYTVAGKTGTARKPQGAFGYVGPDGQVKYQATFVGFAPAEAPKLSVLVMIDEPAGGQIYGGTVAAPLWSKVTEFGLRQLGIPPPVTDGPGGGVPANPEFQAKLAANATAGHGASGMPEDTLAVAVQPDGRVRGVVAGLPPAPTPGPPPTPAAPTNSASVVPTSPPTTRVAPSTTTVRRR